MAGGRRGGRARGARGPLGGSLGREGAVVRLAAGRDGGVRRTGQATAPGDDLDGSACRGTGGSRGGTDVASGVLRARGRQPGLVARGVQGTVGARRGARGVDAGPPSDVTRHLRAASRRGTDRGRLLERLLAGAPRSAIAQVVARGPRGRRRVGVPAAGGRGRDRADLDDHDGVRRGHGAVARDDRRRRMRRRDGGDARGGRVRSRRGLRRRRHRRARLRGIERATRGPHDARRVSPARRPGRLAAREPWIRLGRQPAVVARPVLADRTGRRGRGPRRRLRPAVAGGRPRAAGRRGPRVPTVHAGGDGARSGTARPEASSPG